jgi:hypothetical protein
VLSNRFQGVIPELLGLIDQALNNKVSLPEVCKSNPLLTDELKKWQNQFLSSLGLINLFGVLQPPNPAEQLKMMRQQISQDPNGAIEFTP